MAGTGLKVNMFMNLVIQTADDLTLLGEDLPANHVANQITDGLLLPDFEHIVDRLDERLTRAEGPRESP